ncbi:MAG TPA: hypothetical protein VIK55_19950 [Paludibacter sp.]|jgi:hypothetical protein
MDNDKKNDIAYTLAKAGLGSIPLVGAVASELLQLLVTPPIERRRTKWMTEIGEKIQELETRNLLNLDELRTNEIFIDVVLQTTQQALKTSENEKIEYYKNAIVNTAVGDNPELAEIQIFLNLISDFTVWHIKILNFFDNPVNWFSVNGEPVPSFYSGGLSDILEIAFPELKDRRYFYDLLWADLSRAGLNNTNGLHTIMTGDGLLVSRTTDFGKVFLKFITENSTE